MALFSHTAAAGKEKTTDDENTCRFVVIHSKSATPKSATNPTPQATSPTSQSTGRHARPACPTPLTGHTCQPAGGVDVRRLMERLSELRLAAAVNNCFEARPVVILLPDISDMCHATVGLRNRLLSHKIITRSSAVADKLREAPYF